MNIEEKVEGFIRKKVEEIGYRLYDVYYVKEGKDYFLRVIIDQDKGIDLEDCEKVSNEINPILDQAEFLKDPYFLEVSSPGIERVLRKEDHFEKALGQMVEISLFKPLDGKKEIDGILKKQDGKNIVIEVEGKELILTKKEIAMIKTKYDWEK